MLSLFYKVNSFVARLSEMFEPYYKVMTRNAVSTCFNMGDCFEKFKTFFTPQAVTVLFDKRCHACAVSGFYQNHV